MLQCRNIDNKAMETLAKIFGSDAKVRLMRLFLFNQETLYPLKDIVARSKISLADAKKEINNLVSMGLIRQRESTIEAPAKLNKSSKPSKKTTDKKASPAKTKSIGYILNTKFPYLEALKNLLITATLRADESLTKKFVKSGKIKLFLASGVFLQEWNTRVDLLIVGDELNMDNLSKAVASIEAEIGKELSYSAFETEDFEYRVGIHDRLVRDILDSPHTVLIDKLGVTPQ